MPIYEYRCRACDERFEELVRGPDVVVPCPSCGGRDAERLLSVFAGVGSSATTAAPDPSRVLAQPPAGACGPGCACHH